jgi:cell wall-associated NlpC family hydrolase
MAELPEPSTTDPDPSTDDSKVPEPSPTNPDPEVARQAVLAAHNAKWKTTNWVPQKQINGTHILSDAVAQLGKPHKWGGTTPEGFDSGGLAKYAYQQNGIPMSQQIHNQMQHGSPVGVSQLQPGDLVFVATGDPQMPDRTGVYAGSGIMVHSSPGAGVVASRISHVGQIVGTTHLGSVTRLPTPKPQPVPEGLYDSDEVMPHAKISPYLKQSIANVARIHP